MFPVTGEKNRVGRSVKENLGGLFFGQKCVFYACFTLIGSWEDTKKLKGRDIF